MAIPIMISISAVILAVGNRIVINQFETDKVMAIETAEHKIEMKNSGADGIMVF